MKKAFIALFAISVMLISAIYVDAAEYSPADYSGAVCDEDIVSVDSNEATIVYEWNNRVKGNYSVSFNSISCSDCTVSAVINDGYPITISDIENLPVMGFNTGINSFRLNVRKNSESSSFSVGKIELTYVSEISSDSAFVECNDPVYIDATQYLFEDAGSDMSQNDVSRYTQGSAKPAVVGFIVYAPCGGEYNAELVMSEVGKAYTSDVNMSVNGTEYAINAQSVTKLANLRYNDDAGLMKRYDLKSTVTLDQGINYVAFTAVEGRDSDGSYLFFLDYIRFGFVNEVVETEPNAVGAGTYECDVVSHSDEEYQVIISVVTKDAGKLYDIGACSFSPDNTDYTTLSKGTADYNFSDRTVDVVSEYVEGGSLYGQYRLLQPITLGNSVWVSITSASCEIDKITFVPVLSEIERLYVNPDKKFLNPGDTAVISVYAKDVQGCALNLDYLQKNGAITFKSSDRNILAVDPYGNIKALQAGVAAVTVSVWDGTREITEEVEFNIYDESYGFVMFDAKKSAGEVIVKMISPFDTRNQSHVMIIAEYSGESKCESIHTYRIDGMNEGEIIHYKAPASENPFKIISWNSFEGLTPVYELINIE